MRAVVESIFDCQPESAWNEVQSSMLLLEVMWPLLRFEPVEPSTFPERWREGETVVGQGRVLGFLPVGRHRLGFERIDSYARRIQTRESNRLVRRWDHAISIGEAPNGQTRYRDDIEVEAGLLTPIVWLFALCFYSHRQRRWRRVARRLKAGRQAAENCR